MSLKQIAAVVSFFLLVALIIVIAFFTWQKSSQNMQGDWITGQLGNVFSKKTITSPKMISEIQLEHNENSAFCRYGNQLARCSDGVLTIYDNTGKEVFSQNVYSTNPFLSSEGNWLLLGDYDGRWIYAIQGDEVKWNKEMDGTSITGSINSDGYVSVISKTQGYKAMVTVLNTQGIKYLSRMIAEDSITCSKVLRGTPYYLLCRLNTDGPYIKSSLEYNHLDKQKPISNVTLGDNLYLNINVLSNGKIYLSGDSGVIYLDDSGNKLWQHEYRNLIGTSDMSGGKVLTAVRGSVLNDNADGVNLLLIDKEGKEELIYSTKNEVLGISSAGDNIAVNENRTIRFIGTDGKAFSVYNSEDTIQKSVLLDKTYCAVIMGKAIRFIKYG